MIQILGLFLFTNPGFAAVSCPDIVGDFECNKANTEDPAAPLVVIRQKDQLVIDAHYVQIPVKPGQTTELAIKQGKIRFETTCGDKAMTINMFYPGEKPQSVTYVETPAGITIVRSDSFPRTCVRKK